MDRYVNSFAETAQCQCRGAGLVYNINQPSRIGQINGCRVGNCRDVDVFNAGQCSRRHRAVDNGLQGIGTTATVQLVAGVEGLQAARAETAIEVVITCTAGKGGANVRTSSERNSPVSSHPFTNQRLTPVLKRRKRPLPTTFIPQKADFHSYRLFPLSFQRLSRVTYLYRHNL